MYWHWLLKTRILIVGCKYVLLHKLQCYYNQFISASSINKKITKPELYLESHSPRNWKLGMSKKSLRKIFKNLNFQWSHEGSNCEYLLWNAVTEPTESKGTSALWSISFAILRKSEHVTIKLRSWNSHQIHHTRLWTTIYMLKGYDDFKCCALNYASFTDSGLQWYLKSDIFLTVKLISWKGVLVSNIFSRGL